MTYLNFFFFFLCSDEEGEENGCISPGDAEIELNKDEKKEVIYNNEYISAHYYAQFSAIASQLCINIIR